jgi:hypothetical protein
LQIDAGAGGSCLSDDGFLSYTNIKDMLTQLRYADLVDILSEGDAQRASG